MLKKVAVIGASVVVAGVAAVLALAASKPDEFRIERTTTINAPAEVVFAQVNDMHKWESWSPWEKLDPSMSRTFSGAESGKGAVYEWVGNNDVGEGRMEIVESVPPSNIKIALHFIKPWQGDNTAEFVLQPQGDTTSVTWAMAGKNQFMSKVMQVFLNMDAMVGKNFEDGLSALKETSEKIAAAPGAAKPATASAE